MSRAGWLAIGAVLGGLAGAYLGAPPPFLVGGAGLALAAAVTVGRRQPRAAAGLIAGGFMLARCGAGALLTPPAALESPAPSGDSGWQHAAVVISVSAPAGGTQRAVLELRPPDAPDRVYATLPRYPSIAPGDEVRFRGSLELAPDDDGFGAFLARSGIGYTARARTLERLGADGSPVAVLEGLRRAVADLIAVALPQPQAGLAGAMSIGLRDLVSREVTADFRVSGLSHVVAISGWHIAMLGAVVGAILGGLARRPRTALVLAAISAYAVFAGASPSILRAAVMASVVLLARESGRRGSAAAGLSITVAAMLAIDPVTITDIGFQLSAAATAGLLAWGGRVREWLATRLPKRTPSWLLESLAVSTAAQAATLPLVLLHFGSLSVVSPFANMLIAPLVAPAMLSTAVAFGCGALIGLGVPAMVVAPFALVGSLIVGAMIAIAHFCAGLPFASVSLPAPLNVAAAAGCAVLVARVVRRRTPGPSPSAVAAAPRRSNTVPRVPRHVAAAGTALMAVAILFAIVYAARPDGRLHLTVLDVGQGDSILIEGPKGGRILVDGGPDPDRLIALLDARIPQWDRRIDLLVLSHPHEDHVAGLAAVLERYRVVEVVEPGMVGPGPGDAAYRRQLAQLDRQSRVVAAGDQLSLDGMRLDVRWPMRGTVPLRPPDNGTAINNVSIVLDVRFGSRRMVLTGDVEQQIDTQLLAAGLAADATPIDVLKVAHHGSATATTDAFLEQTSPRIAVISAGWGNPYGHPSAATVGRLRERGARLFRTDIDGSVDISTDGVDLLAAADGGRPRAPDRPPPQPGVGFCPIGPTASARRRTYNRADVDPVARGSGPDPPHAGASRLACRALGGGGGRGCLPGRRDRAARPRDQRRARRGCRAVARYRQGTRR